MKENGANMVLRKSLAYLALATALGTAQTAHAAYWAWNGSSTSPSYWDDQSLWVLGGAGTATFQAANHNFKTKYSTGRAFASGWDYTVTFRNLFTSMTGPLTVSAGSPGSPIVFVAESAGCGISSSGALVLDGEVEADPCLHIQSGTYQFARLNLASSPNTNGTLNVSGGTVTFNGYSCVGYGGTGYLNVSGGTVAANGYACIGYGSTGYLNISGGLVKNVANYIQLGATANGVGVVTVTSGGAYENLEGNGSFTIGHAANSVGILNVQGGAVTIKGQVYLCYNANAVSATVNVTDGGVLTATAITQTNPGVNGNTVTVDGGTIRAYASSASFMPAGSKLHVYAGANGATFDAATFDVTIGEDIEDKPGAVGNVTFTGDGGTVRLTGALNYTGATYLNQKAHLVVKDSAMLQDLLTKGLTVVGSAKGTYTILSIADGTPCTPADYARIAKGAGLQNAMFGIDENGAITISASHFAQTWSGAAGVSAAWSGPNWDGGATFDFGNDAVFATAGAIADVDAATEALSLTFSESATLTGSAALTVPTVSVAANAEALISAPTAGQLEKLGPGALTLGASRADLTVLSEGTLTMAAGTSLDWSKLTLGTDPQKSVVLRLPAGATLEIMAATQLYLGETAGGTVELDKGDGDWTSARLFMASGKNATARYYHRGGTHTINGYSSLGYNAESDSSVTYFEISGGTVTNAANYLSVGRYGEAGCTSVMTVKTGGTFGTQANLVVGYEASGVLNVEGGTVLVGNGNTYLCYDPKCGSGEDSAINLTQGGTLTTKQVRHGASNSAYGSALSTLRFDGGTLRAAANSTTFLPAHANLAVTVDAGGGTIDANGYAITIGEDLTGAGGMTFAGGGNVTLSKMPAYSGKTTVEVGTQLVVPSAIAGGNLAFTVPAGTEDGPYAMVTISGSGTFAESVLDDIAKPEGVTLCLSANKKTIYCIRGDLTGRSVWIGGTSTSLNDGANWLSGSVPHGGEAIICVPSDTTLANPPGSAFAATSIFFPAHSAKVTFGGTSALGGLLSISNNAAQHHVFNVPVSFASGAMASVTMSEAGYMDFAGGVTMYDLDTSGGPHYCGTFTVTTDGDWGAGAGSVLMENAALNLPNGTYYDLAAGLTVASGATLTVKRARLDGAADGSYRYLLNTNNGIVKVLDEFYISASPRFNDVINQWGGGYMENTRGTGAFIFNKLRMDENGLIIASATAVMGPEGIVRGGGIVRMLNSGTHTFGSSADWTMRKEGEDDASDPIFIKQGGASRATLTFDTSDWNDATIPRKITCRAPICGANADQPGNISMIVKGNGEFAFETSYDDTSAWKVFAGGLTVQDEATVSVKPRCNPGKGAVTMCSGTTLKVAGSGTVALGGALTLADDTTLAFNFSERGVTPVLVATNGVTVAGEVKVEVSATGNVRPKGGDHVLTAGGGFTGKTVSLVTDGAPDWLAHGNVRVNDDGDIVLYIVPDGTIILFR